MLLLVVRRGREVEVGRRGVRDKVGEVEGWVVGARARGREGAVGGAHGGGGVRCGW
jgi:hypothetical protein